MLDRVVDTACTVHPAALHIVIGKNAKLITEHFAERPDISWVVQEEQLGTGHAVQQAMPVIDDESIVVILCGDVPLISSATVQAAVDGARDGLIVVTVDKHDPTGFGRIIRGDDGRITRIVEHRDASAEERAVCETNTGIMAGPKRLMAEMLSTLTTDNEQGEYYLTDIVGAAEARGHRVVAVPAQNEEEVQGVNDRVQLAELERHLQEQTAIELMRQGVTVADPRRLDVRGTLTAGMDCFIDVDVVFQGQCELGENVRIGAGCVISESKIDSNTTIFPHSVINEAHVGEDCNIGPFARLREGTDLEGRVRIGNFVETKKAVIGYGSKASHLAYLGDTNIGKDVNVGAGSITCNYDGVNKLHTHIGDGVFVGTNSTLVAPLHIENEAFIGAGSTITKKVEKHDLAIGRQHQKNIKNWKRPKPKS